LKIVKFMFIFNRNHLKPKCQIYGMRRDFVISLFLLIVRVSWIWSLKRECFNHLKAILIVSLNYLYGYWLMHVIMKDLFLTKLVEKIIILKSMFVWKKGRNICVISHSNWFSLQCSWYLNWSNQFESQFIVFVLDAFTD